MRATLRQERDRIQGDSDRTEAQRSPAHSHRRSILAQPPRRSHGAGLAAEGRCLRGELCEARTSKGYQTWSCHVCQRPRRAHLPSRIPPMRISHRHRTGGCERRREGLVLQKSGCRHKDSPRRGRSLNTAARPTPSAANRACDIPRGDFKRGISENITEQCKKCACPVNGCRGRIPAMRHWDVECLVVVR